MANRNSNAFLVMKLVFFKYSDAKTNLNITSIRNKYTLVI